ncbi:MAG: hypothetical protein NC225_09905 [Clostridium sp.]|nr:hypothetical protein [Clostridium sp.]MCM1399777.1 hypothetical protein [Clostridium sp.]MCM1459596.1 hypothetical protein [Bacteroides sp.]
MKADYGAKEFMRVAFVAPVYMNPKQKREDDSRRRKKRTLSFEQELREREYRDLPEDSTVIYYA